MTGLKVTGLDLKNVPNWLDNTWIKRKLNDNLNGKLCVDITSYVKIFLSQGGGLGGSSAATTRPDSKLMGNPRYSSKPRTPSSSRTLKLFYLRLVLRFRSRESAIRHTLFAGLGRGPVQIGGGRGCVNRAQRQNEE